VVPSNKIKNVAWFEAYLPTKWHLDSSRHLATTDIDRKLGAVPLWEGDLGPHITQYGRGRGLPACQDSS